MGITRLGRKLAVTAVAGTSVMMLVAPRAIADPSETLRPTGRGQTVSAAKAAGGKTTSNGISYHGGRVQTGQLTIVPIWYGAGWNDTTTNAAGLTKKQLVQKFLSGLGGSTYFNINTTYYNGSGVAVPNVQFVVNAGYSDPTYTKGYGVSDSGVLAEVNDAFNAVGLVGPNVQYAFFGDPSTTLTSGYGTQYCGWHTHSTVGGQDLSYQATIDTPQQYMSACAAQTTSPNGFAGTDAMLSVVAHEVEESATDPQLNAWYDSRGYENADKCAWTFGTTLGTQNGGKYNVTFADGMNYYIQRNWVNKSGGYCSMSY